MPYRPGRFACLRAFARHWAAATKQGIGSSWFGGASAAGAVVLAVILDTEKLQPWATPVLSAALALVFALGFQAFLIAPFKAARMLRPFKVRAKTGFPDTNYPIGSRPRSQELYLEITNKSYMEHRGCVAHVTEIANFDNETHALPKLIKEFSILPNETQSITILAWTSRQPNGPDDTSLMLSGPVACGWGDNFVQLPTSPEQILSVRLGVSDAKDYVITVVVWVERHTLKCRVRL